jgi:hypothetical protein
MLTLKEWMTLVDYKITEGSDYFTNIPELYSLSSWNGEHDGWSFFIAFDPKDAQRVYVVEACDYKNQRAYRLKDPAIELDDQAWDDVKFTELEIDDDFIQKALAIKDGEDYDTCVKVLVDFPDKDDLLKYFMMAHEMDITFNDLAGRALKAAVDEYERSTGERLSDETNEGDVDE